MRTVPTALPLTRRRPSLLESWREEILAKAWESLRRTESEGGRPLFSVLKYRSQHPEATSARMALDLTAALRLDTSLTDTAVRKSLQRARERFAELLVDEVKSSLDGSRRNLRDELEALDLLRTVVRPSIIETVDLDAPRIDACDSPASKLHLDGAACRRRAVCRALTPIVDR